jgi:hypothetical protein
VNIHRQRAALSGALSISGKAISLSRADQQRFSHKCACLAQVELPSLTFMNNLARISILASTVLITASLSLDAGTSPQEKAFIDKYKTAFEGKDTATLESFLYTQGADPAILGFYKMMQSGEAGEKISNIELVDLTPDDAKKAATPMDSPTGGKVCLTLKPTKKLIIKVEKKDANGSSTSTSENFIAEKDGKFVIPVPGPCK